MYHARLADAWQPCPQVPRQICATLCVPSCVPLLKGALSFCAHIHNPSWQVPHVAQYLSWKHALRSHQCTACARRATCTCCCVMGASVCVAVAAGQHVFRKCVFLSTVLSYSSRANNLQGVAVAVSHTRICPDVHAVCGQSGSLQGAAKM
jgi:hypothetical protein